MANAPQSTTTAAKAIPVIVAQRAMAVLRENIVMARAVYNDARMATDFGATFDVGNTLNIRLPGIYTAQSKVTGSDVTLQNYTMTQVQVVLNTHSEVSIRVDDPVRFMANTNIIQAEAEAMTYALAISLEDALQALYSDLNTVGTGGTKVSPADVRAAAKALDDAKAPATDRHLVLSTNDTYGLLGDPDMQTYFSRTQIEAMTKGLIGELYGFQVYKSQAVTDTGGITYNPAFHSTCFGFAMRGMAGGVGSTPGAEIAVIRDDQSGLALRSVYGYNINQLGQQLTLDMLYGVKTLRSAMGVAVLGEGS